MSNTVIRVENLSKQYRLGVVGTGTLSHDLNRWWYKVRGKEDPYLKIGETNDRATKGTSDYVWALKNINFDVKQGEVLGIIGKNGAGKSTLLKLLSRVTSPTTGSIKVKGRIASLLEVGTGFHPEMTGRENIYLNGTILGMTKTEIRKKFDEIVEFSGTARYIDTPVKRYSSGMHVRLAFAVAAHLEPEILIVDEVLAVGDAEFQKKAIGKMQDVAKGGGRTVLFVSHNMSAVKRICNSSILLKNGTIANIGDVDQIIDEYIKDNESDVVSLGELHWQLHNAPKCEEVSFNYIRILNENKEVSSSFYTSKPLTIEISYNIKKEIVGSRFFLQLLDNKDTIAFSSTNQDVDGGRKGIGTYVTTCTIPPNLLNSGRYFIYVKMGIPGVKVLIDGRVYLSFDTILMGNNGSTYQEDWPGLLAPKLKWESFKV